MRIMRDSCTNDGSMHKAAEKVANWRKTMTRASRLRR